ncbi:MAG: hypothetical protein JW956_05880 [Calditrichaceae bacterium]|nr:hypothetical protein [Calditrichaceae bacterium]
MEHTFKDLKHMKVDQLREIAAATGEDGIQGYTQLNKEHLLEAICTFYHIDMYEHHDVVGVDKMKIKSRIKDLKKEREEAIEKKDKAKLAAARKEIKKLKRALRRAMV